MNNWKLYITFAGAMITSVITYAYSSLYYYNAYVDSTKSDLQHLEPIFSAASFESIELFSKLVNTYADEWVIFDRFGEQIANSEELQSAPREKYKREFAEFLVNISGSADLWEKSDTQSAETFTLYFNVEQKELSISVLFISAAIYIFIILLIISIVRIYLDKKNGEFKSREKNNKKLIKVAKKEISELTLHNKTLNEERIKLTDTIQKQREGRSLFVADLCHEIRTPLNSLVSNILLVADKKKLAIHGERINKIQHLLSCFLDDFINIARTEGANYTVTEEWLNIYTLVEDAVEIVRLRHPNAIDIVITCPHKKMECLTDHLRLKQILINLITNALKYGDDLVHIDISTSIVGLPTISVRDFGKGINRDIRSKIFNAFERCNHNQSNEYDGIGLGLHIVANICKAIGARVEVFDSHPRGSIFSVTLKDKPKNSTPKIDCSENAPIAFIGEASPIKLSLLQTLSNGFSIETFNNKDSFINTYRTEDPLHAVVFTYGISEDSVEAIINLYPTIKLLNLSENPDNSLTYKDTIESFGATYKPAPNEHSTKNILLIDDTPTNAERVRQIAGSNYNVFVLDNIFDALIAVHSKPFDLILVDLMLFDDEFGYDLICRIRLSGLNTQTAIQAYTAAGLKSFLELCLLSGADGILQKPIPIDFTIEDCLEPEFQQADCEIPNNCNFDIFNFSGADFINHKEASIRKIKDFLARENGPQRTIADEMFGYFLTLENDYGVEIIIDYIMNRFREACRA